MNLVLVASLDHTIDEDGKIKEMKDELAPQVYGFAEVGRGRVAVATDDEITVWNLATSSRSSSLGFRRIGKGTTGGGRNPNDIVYVFGTDWSPEREEMAVALSDGTVRVVNLMGELKAVLTIPEENTRATNAKWTKGGRGLATTFSTGHVLTWEFEAGSEKPRCKGVYVGQGICYGTEFFPPRGIPSGIGCKEDEEVILLSYGQKGNVFAFNTLLPHGDPIGWGSKEDGGELFDATTWWDGNDAMIAFGGRNDGGAIGVPIQLYRIKAAGE